MDLFVIQPTYSLHSLLRPNRSLDMAAQRADPARATQGKEPHAAVRDEANARFCDA